jgi:beta-lactamase regulating signal transducer with metallopeptidase domain
MFVLLAAKSLVIAGGTLIALRLTRARSASDRSLVAHLGLAALTALPLGSVLFPPLEVTTYRASFLADAAPVSSGAQALAGSDWLFVAYAVIALLLLARMLLALMRLVMLTARARTVTDDQWLLALARNQRRIGLTRSPALLVSREIASSISWGMLRPKIVLNTDAVAASEDTDAILAHELAHLARADWVKLMLARVSMAVFWFNPFVWLLAREAYQLREEAADDAVLAADVEDMAYASLLVSSARQQNDCRLLGAHGVAPARSSLTQRVQRVLDRGLNRSAGGPRWAAAMIVGITALTVPLITLQLTDGAPASPGPAPFASDHDGKVIVFDLRAPPRKPNTLPKSMQETSNQAAADGERRADAMPANINDGL